MAGSLPPRGVARFTGAQTQWAPPKLSPASIQWLYQAITLGDPRQHQFEFCLWTLQIIRQLLRREFQVALSKSAVSRLLAQ